MEYVYQSGALTVAQFLTFAQIGRTKFYQEVEAGRIVPRKLGRKTLVLRKDAEAWLNNLPEAAA